MVTAHRKKGTIGNKLSTDLRSPKRKIGTRLEGERARRYAAPVQENDAIISLLSHAEVKFHTAIASDKRMMAAITYPLPLVSAEVTCHVRFSYSVL